ARGAVSARPRRRGVHRRQGGTTGGAQGGRPAVKIAEARVIVCSPGRNFVTLKITTDDGLTGVGDATLNGRELAVASYLGDHVCPALVGRDAARIEGTGQY